MAGASEPGDVTRLLREAQAGDKSAHQQAVSLLYDDLYARAARQMRKQPAGHTLEPAALVAEVYLKLAKECAWMDRGHFLATASLAMKQVLADYGRRKRPRCDTRVALESLSEGKEVTIGILELTDLLERLRAIDEPMARAVEMRYLAGLSVAETAEALGKSKRTFEREWKATLALLLSWLSRE